jgi:hypothetical protein
VLEKHIRVVLLALNTSTILPRYKTPDFAVGVVMFPKRNMFLFQLSWKMFKQVLKIVLLHYLIANSGRDIKHALYAFSMSCMFRNYVKCFFLNVFTE